MSQASQRDKYIKLGILQGPKESMRAYLARAKKLSSLPSLTCSDGIKALAIVEKLYGISPSWVKVKYVDSGIRFWEGGATYIENGIPTICMPKKKRFLGPSNVEIIAHEMVHAARSAFPNSSFEELFAYQTSKSWLYRLLGPLFPSNYAILFLVTLLLFNFALFFEQKWMMVISGISFGTFFVLRPIWFTTIFNITKKKLSPFKLVQHSFKTIFSLI